MIFCSLLDGDDGVYFCGHSHLVVRGAMNCLVPEWRELYSRMTIGVFRSFDKREFIDFLESLKEML